MGVSAAMYAAVTGLQTMGDALGVVSNNIANSNTVGFKTARAEFVDLLSQQYVGASASSQMGRGVRMGAIRQIFSQGPIESSSQATDLAISGNGFFQVRDDLTGELFYTRAGNFIYDKDGNLSLPTGQILQGYELDDEGNRVGVPEDMTLPDTFLAGDATGLATYILNLNSDAESGTKVLPLSRSWNALDGDGPIDSGSYEYQTTLRVYDSLGGAHNLTVYFDPMEDPDMPNTWEYIICTDPEDDARTIPFDASCSTGAYPVWNGSDTSASFLDYSSGSTSGTNDYQHTRYGGLLMRGTISFESRDDTAGRAGKIRNITAEQLASNDATNYSAATTFFTSGANSILMDTRGPYDGSVDTSIVFTCSSGGNFSSATNLPDVHWLDSVTGESGDILDAQINTWYSTPSGLEIRFRGSGMTTLSTAATGISAACTSNWEDAALNSDGFFDLRTAFELTPSEDPGAPDPSSPIQTPVEQTITIDFGAHREIVSSSAIQWISDNLATVQYGSESSSLFRTQDGYAPGQLQEVEFGEDGVLSATYSNGEVRQPWMVSLWTFPNQWGLEKVGNNLYEKTRESGDQTDSPPGTNGTGTILPNSLEQSNVDLADEFVEMIIQQRGFQANSKVITTTDSMLSELINLKR